MSEEAVQDAAPQVSPEDQAAIDRYQESQKPLEERNSEMPEGYNDDGTPKDDLIGGKFKSQDDLLEAYQQLEKKLSQPKEVTEEPNEPTAEKPNEETKDEAVSDGAFSITTFEEEYAANGSLSDKSYEALAEKGFTREQVDAYIKGQQYYGESLKNTVYSSVGGEEQYKEVVNWASENMPPDVIKRYNDAVDRLDQDAMLQTLEYMALKKGSSTPQQARRLEGDSPASGIQPFADKNEWQRMQSNRLYGKDAKYTNMVDQRYLAARKKGIL